MEAVAGRSVQKCLVVDNEPSICQIIAFALDTEGWDVRACGDLASAKKAVAHEAYDLAVIDLRLGRRSGLELLPLLQAEQPGIPTIIMTAYASISGAVDAIRRGAADYLPKPFNPVELRRAVTHVMAMRSRQRQAGDLRSKPVLESHAPAMQVLLDRVSKVAQSGTTTVLLRGETGTGKGVMAKALHDLSPRRDAPFVVVSCPALPLDMLESELFGHVRGAFTGAHQDHQGRLTQAEGGTLFLDEVGDLPLGLQTKLLRVLQEREYECLGGSQTLKADVRVVSATNVDLEKAVQEGRFRQDLYYRLGAVELRIPPLRERRDDLPKLIDVMLGELRAEVGRGPTGLGTQALARLKSYDWPGNLRELRNFLERVCVLGKGGELGLEDLAGLYAERGAPESPIEAGPLASMEQVEAEHIRRVLARTHTLEEAAQVLGLAGVTLWRKRKKYGI